MKKIYLLLTLSLALIACKKVDVSFSYSPDAPKAGEVVKFSNLSSGGEEWEWAFGDGSVSTLKSPSHTYKRPGTYRVSLKVDNKKSLMMSQDITVYDTVPTFVCADSVFYIFTDYTFTANVYNPYNYPVQYQWYWITDPTAFTNAPFCVTDNEWNNSTLNLYFTQKGQVIIGLLLTLNGESFRIEKAFDIQDLATNSVLIRNAQNDWRQRIYGDRAENAFPDASASALLDAEQDTAQLYNGTEFRLSELKQTFPFLEGFHIASRKIYFRAEGLWVANIDGAYPVLIDSLDCYAMTLDTKDSRIYWANENGVWYMPLVGSDNNKFVTIPVQLNTLTGVTKLAADYDAK